MQRLPDWISHSHIIEDDIKTHSRPLSVLHATPAPLLKNLARMGIQMLFPVQSAVVPELLSSTHGPLLMCKDGELPRDIVVCAPTGCGKTLAYALPIVCALHQRVMCQVRALVLVPSQELAAQVHQVFAELVHGTSLTVDVLTDSAQLREECSYPLASSLDIVIATPTQLSEHIQWFSSFSFLRYLVLDEADKLLGHSTQCWLPKLLRAFDETNVPALEQVLGGLCTELLAQHWMRVPKHSRRITSKQNHLQKLLFSATMTFDPEHLSALRLQRPLLYCVGSALVSVDSAFTLPPRLEEMIVRCPSSSKPLALFHLTANTENGVLCFTNSRDTCQRLMCLLHEMAVTSVDAVNSTMSLSRRKEALDNFRRSNTKVLVCTDQLARGMDLGVVGSVINYDPPRQYGTYLHRAGRTARAGAKGVVYTLLNTDEVHPFKTMLRRGTKRKVDEISLTDKHLNVYKKQYTTALSRLQSNST